MDLDLTPTPTPTKSPDDTEIDTPPHTHTQAIKPLFFTSSEFKNRHHHRPPPPVVVEYKECMKNHAATMGGHAVDGCGEYMPAPSAAPTDPTSLTCAACGCHRNFHRREPDSPTTAITPPFLDFRRPPQAKRTSPSSSPHPPFPYAPPHMLLAFSTAVAADEHHQEPLTPTADNPVGRKRFRTKFSQEQKEKMHSFSEKLGWKMQKSDEAAVEEFCREVGVAKGVLKVWMHNNKNTFGKKETINSRNIINGRLITFENNINGGNSNSKNEEIKKTDNGSHFQNESGSSVHFHDSNNGSCSSP